MGWTDVLASGDVAPGTVVALDVDDRELAVWRTASGVLVACAARCPHQWSHLGVAGVVDGEDLVCLSHWWCFDTAGRGAKVSMAGRRDRKSDVATFPVRERDGRVEVLLDVEDATG